MVVQVLRMVLRECTCKVFCLYRLYPFCCRHDIQDSSTSNLAVYVDCMLLLLSGNLNAHETVGMPIHILIHYSTTSVNTVNISVDNGYLVITLKM